MFKLTGGLQGRRYERHVCATDFPLRLSARPGYAAYRWSSGDSLAELTVAAPGRYIVEHDYGCGAVRDTFDLLAEYPAPPPDLGPDRYNCSADTLTPQRLEAPGQPNYHWSTGEKSPWIEVRDSGWYALEVRYEVCPPRGDSLRLLGCPPNYAYRLAFPDVFTPNGDGVNDFFKPSELYNLSWDRIEIYDRWGRKHFESRSPWPGWDGAGAAPGVYHYQLRFRKPVSGEAAYQSGSLTLLR